VTELNRVIDRYVAIWNETDPDKRRVLIAEAFTEDGAYLGPLLDGDGHAGIEAMAQGIQAHLAGHRFRRIGEIDAHHDRVRYSWEILTPDVAERFAAGTDFVVLAPDGRLRSVTAFLDQAPAQPAPH
jgi:hypothetical protein